MFVGHPVPVYCQSGTEMATSPWAAYGCITGLVLGTHMVESSTIPKNSLHTKKKKEEEFWPHLFSDLITVSETMERVCALFFVWRGIHMSLPVE